MKTAILITAIAYTLIGICHLGIWPALNHMEFNDKFSVVFLWPLIYVK